MKSTSHLHHLYRNLIMFGLMERVPKNMRMNFLPDSTVDEDLKNGEKKIRPDISYYADASYANEDCNHANLTFVVEVVNTNGVAYSTGRIRELFRREPTLEEAFLYNYEERSWKRFLRENGTVDENEKSYSKTFGFYMTSIEGVK